MSQDYETELPNDSCIFIGIAIDRVSVDAYDDSDGIHLYMDSGKAREIASALIAAADRLDGMAKEAKP